MKEQLETAKLTDAQEILRLYRVCGDTGRTNGSSEWNDLYPDEESMLEQLRYGQLFVTRDGEGIASAVTVLETDDIDEEAVDWSAGRSFVLCRVCVRPELQGRGLGARTITLAMRRMGEAGYEYAHLMTPTVNLAAQAMYKKLGFRRLGMCNEYDTDFIIYEKAIADGKTLA